jgi:hypothetical protein
MIQPLAKELYNFLCFRFWSLVAKPRIRLDQNLVCELLLPSGTYVQSFGSMAPADTKRAMLTDDNDYGLRQTPRDRIGSSQASQKG